MVVILCAHMGTMIVNMEFVVTVTMPSVVGHMVHIVVGWNILVIVEITLLVWFSEYVIAYF